MVRIRITLEDDDGHEINGDTERVYDVPDEAGQLVDIAAALECLTQQALPPLEAELLLLAQHQFVAEVTEKGLLNWRRCVRPRDDVLTDFRSNKACLCSSRVVEKRWRGLEAWRKVRGSCASHAQRRETLCRILPRR